MRHRFGFALACMTLAVFAGRPEPAAAAPAQESLVLAAEATLEKVANEQELQTNVPRMLSRAKAVLIFPSLLKGAFLVGGEGGSGVLLSRNQNGIWSYPAFYTMGTLSIGLQIGGQESEAILLIMTDEALEAVLNDQVKLGVDASIAAGPVGVGVGGATTTNVDADIIAYSTNRGLFFGGSFEGAVIARRNDWNHAFYGEGATPRGIVVEQKFENPRADTLRQALSKY